MSRIARRALAGVVLLAIAMPLPPALAQAPSAARDDGWVNRRVNDGTIVFPSAVSPDDPFIAVRTATGLVWLDARPMAAPLEPMRAGDRIAVDGYATTRADVLIPVEIRHAGTASGHDTSQPAAAPGATRAATPAGGLGGAWSGHWTDERDGRRRPAELIITVGRDPSQLVGQLTLMGGARTWTARYEGTAADGGARFPLPGGGMITVHRAADDRLTGEFSAPGGPLPAQTGALELSRVR